MAIIPRAISPVFLKMLSQYPVVTLTGPRQCGNTPNGNFSDNISTFRKHFPTADKGAVIYSGDTHPGGPQHVDLYNFADSARLLKS